jgi:hypothetical protein
MWQVRWGRALLISGAFALLLGPLAGAAVLGGVLVLVSYDWLRPVVGVREMPNFDTEAEALAYWRFTRNPVLPVPPAAVRMWRWQLGSESELRR